jgi:hypothetical protein
MKGSSGVAADNQETAKWDPAFTEQVKNAFRPVGHWWCPTTPAASPRPTY